jgi:tetratricopeptide (TPR) repeat protein
LARKQKHRSPPVSPAVLQARVQRAQEEGRFQTALDLARQLYKDEPTAEHLALLRDVLLGRARQLRAQGKTRDALGVLELAQRLPEAPREWLEQVAAEMALCGGAAQALAVLDRLGEATPAAARVRGHAADGAVQDHAGRAALPEALRGELDAVLDAFHRMQTGDDEGARARLQCIGLRSPFLEWKLLLRGLQAYYQGDDARAVENWQRLDAGRLPARLAAPFRFAVDAGFRAAQPPATQAAVRRQLEVFQGSALPARLRELRAALENKNSLAAAFRHAEQLLPALRQQAPHLVGRLASCMYWAATNTGPEDVTRYRRVFGPPADDPNFHRLHALAHEKAGNRAEAHHFWGLYEKDLAAHPDAWPGGHAERARALVWLRMGHNAVSALDEEEPESFPFWFGPEPSRPDLRPSPEQCFRHATELAADLLEPYEALFRYHLQEDHTAKAEKAGRNLLQHFPDHAPTLQEMADLVGRRGKSDEALRLLQAALHANPLDRDLRERLAAAHLDHARTLILNAHLDEARQQLQAAHTLRGADNGQARCLEAALEFKAGNTTRAEELLGQVIARGVPAPLIAYTMLTEAVRVKLPPAVKTRFDREFKAAVAGPPDGTVAAALLAQSTLLEQKGVEYYGRKSHAKKIRDYADRAAAAADLAEEPAVTLAQGLLEAGATRPFRRLVRSASRRFPQNPFFPLLEAASCMLDDPDRVSFWRVRSLLDEAERRARAQPQDERMRVVVEQIEEQRRELNRLDPYPTAFERYFGGGPAEDEDEFYDEDDYG